jgi:hypothetical protein
MAPCPSTTIFGKLVELPKITGPNLQIYLISLDLVGLITLIKVIFVLLS